MLLNFFFKVKTLLNHAFKGSMAHLQNIVGSLEKKYNHRNNTQNIQNVINVLLRILQYRVAQKECNTYDH